MWKVTVRSPNSQPKVFHIRPGKNIIGRSPECDIIVDDVSASRQHAELEFLPDVEGLTLNDLDSSNGTYVNHRRITEAVVVTPRDTLRIGNCTLNIESSAQETPPERVYSGTQPLTREVLLESLDQQSVMISEITSQLNAIFDVPTALQEVSRLMQTALGADHIDFILAEHFDKLRELSLPEAIAHEAIEKRSTVVLNDMTLEAEYRIGQLPGPKFIRTLMVVPVLLGEDLAGLIYLYKTAPAAPLFDQRDLQLAVSISHQAALVLQRARLVIDFNEYQLIQSLIARFVDREEAEHLLEEYLQRGKLPGPRKQNMAILSTELVSLDTLTRQLGPERFGDLLERFQAEVREAVFIRHGLAQFVGASATAVFDEALVAQSPQVRAVRAGFEILQRIQAMGKDFDCDPPWIGVGIASGSMIAGYVGTKEHTDYFLLGEAANLAAHLRQLAYPQRLLLDPSTCTLVQDRFEMQELGEFPIPGREFPLAIYEVLSALD